MTPDDIRKLPVGESTDIYFEQTLEDQNTVFNLTDFNINTRSIGDALQFEMTTALRTIRNMRDEHSDNDKPRPEFSVTAHIDFQFSYGGDIGFKGVIQIARTA